MYRALYPFHKSHPTSLSFQPGDVFVQISGASKDKNWYYVLNGKGNIGYVPQNFVQPMEDDDDDLHKFLDDVENRVREDEEIPEKEKSAVFEKIHEARSKEVAKEFMKPPLQLKKKRIAPKPPTVEPMKDEQHRPSSSSNKLTLASRELIDVVRSNSGLSHDMSQSTVILVLRYLVDHGLDGDIGSLVREMSQVDVDVVTSSDARIMENLLTQLTQCKEDDQQRNWMLYEDESRISALLSDLYRSLRDSDGAVSIHVMSRFKYFYVQCLIEYFQMETRWNLRKSLIEIFTTMCSLAPAPVIPLMLSSVLPLELAQDMFQNSESPCRLRHSALLLTVIFSSGEPMPIHYFDQLGKGFVTFLLDYIEETSSSHQTEDEQEVVDVFVGLILSYNLQFKDSNVFIDVLADRSSAKIYTEKILLLLNREDDPSALLESNRSVNATHKVIIDMFQHDTCHRLFYTNDIYVLIDIVVRQLTDLSPNDRYRTTYIQMCDLVLRHTDYSDHLHRFKDLKRCFIRILDDDESKDKETVFHIIKTVDAFKCLDQD